jgi:hypothetical protein
MNKITSTQGVVERFKRRFFCDPTFENTHKFAQKKPMDNFIFKKHCNLQSID